MNSQMSQLDSAKWMKVAGRIFNKIKEKLGMGNLTDRRDRAEISESREMRADPSREMMSAASHDVIGVGACAYCKSVNFVKRGTRKKKFETAQLYLCRDCGRAFTASAVKGKHYPMRVVIEGMSYYNLGFSLAGTVKILKQKFGAEGPYAKGINNLGTGTLGGWITQYAGLCRYARLRPYANKLYSARDMVETVTMAHRQLYRFRYHRGKMKLVLQEFKHRHLKPLKDYLDAVSTETPHQYFQEGSRISEVRSKFDKAQMIVRAKSNYANELARFVLQAVTDNKQRHEEVQRFMIANDSVTVATEVPVYIRKEDIEHMENQLNFKILGGEEIERPSADIASENGPGFITVKGKKTKEIPRLLTGHIDLVQVRNGQVHILDYKPNAAKEKPIEQLTWYALALSRLTGLRLYEFKCAWFDDKDYFEFYPLHVVHKSSKKRRKRFGLKSGVIVEVPEEDKVVVA